MCGKSSKKFLVLLCAMLVASSALFAFGWDRGRTPAPVTPAITPTETEASVSAPEPEASLVISSEPEAVPEVLATPVIEQEEPSELSSSVASSIESMNALIEALELSKKASKNDQMTLSNLRNELSLANETFSAYKAESMKLAEENEALSNELYRLHLGFGLGATYAPFENLENFGVEAAVTLRKGGLMLLTGVEYPDMMNVLDFDYNKLKIKGMVICEF